MELRRPARRSITAMQNPCPGADACAKQIELADVHVPTGEVDPNGEFVVEVEVINHSGQLPIFLPGLDGCGHGANPCSTVLDNGMCVSVHVDPQWTGESSDFECHEPVPFSPANKTRTVDVPGPGTEGTKSLNVWLELPGSGEMTHVVTENVTFAEGGTVTCETDGDCPGDLVCVDNECVSSSNGGGGDNGFDIQMILILVLVIVVAAAGAKAITGE